MVKIKIIFGLLALTVLAAAAPFEDDEDSFEDMYDNEDDSTEEFLTFEDWDGKWHNISLTEELGDDELYDFSREFSELDDFDDVLRVSSANSGEVQPRKISNNVIPSLYTNDEPDTPYDLTPVNSRDAPFDINNPTKVIVHGWLENGDKMWVLRMKDKYIIDDKYNVIAVDWYRYAIMEYTFAARKAKKIGAYLGQVLVSLIKAEKIYAKDIHIAGHSLGAHIAGYAAKAVKAQTGQTVGRITAMDAARPLFESPFLVSKKKRLHKDDALFVDAIHTCGGSLGFKRAFGHADFFPNSGKPIQPGCGLLKNHICSHARGYAFYTESINSESFLATPCKSWKTYKKGKCDTADRIPMGKPTPLTATGSYYLRTNKRKPYAKG